MHLFWETLIAPLMRALDARRILEIGSDYGHHTRHLLDYCREVDGFLDVVDPLPKYDHEEWGREAPEHVAFHLELSLNVLPRLAPADVVLIDGDHNWYTVYHELHLLDKAARAAGVAFPLVLLHDVGWPYGRRDLYYDPETIPPAFRQPFRKQGLKPGMASPAESGGLNPHLCNSIYEHNLKNGVLTAVEDFQAESGCDLRFEALPGLHGLGILYPAGLEARADFAQLMAELRPTPRQRIYLELLERERLGLQVCEAEQARELRARQHDAERLGDAERARTELAGRLEAAERARAELAGRLERAERERAELAETERARAELAERLQEAEAERAGLADSLLRAERERDALSRERDALAGEHDALARERDALSRDHDALSERLSGVTADYGQLSGLVHGLERDYLAVRDSLRWKVGHRLMRVLEVLLMRGKPPLVMDRMAATFESVRAMRPAPNRFAPSLTDRSQHP